MYTTTEELHGLRDAWAELAKVDELGSLFRSPTWLLAWWHAYREALKAEPLVVCCYDEDQLVALAPMYRRVDAGGGIKVREVRMMGDAGPRPPSLGFLVAPGYEEQSGTAIADALRSIDPPWDVLDLQPLSEVSRLRAFFIQRLDSTGKRVRSSVAGGTTRIAMALHGSDLDEVLPANKLACAYTKDGKSMRKGLAALRRLSRLEWADRDEASPIAETEGTRLLQDVAAELGPQGRARLARLDEASGEACACALVVDDGDRAVVIALAVDPEHVGRGAGTRLLEAEARAAVERGCVALDVVIGAGEHDPPPLPTSRQRSLRLCIFNTSTSAAFARTVGAVRRRVDAAREAPGAAAASARAAWSRIRAAAATVAAFDKFHLYRGELWIRGIAPTVGLELSVFSEADFDALEDAERTELCRVLELDADYCRSKWRRGDFVVLARIDGQPAGIAWCARTAVRVPELDRDVRPGEHECYIHDVFVAPTARGRTVAPSMLEFIAQELRQQDVYRSWALIAPENVASIRAFEKAAYTAVADIVYARMATVERVSVRPPDPEAKQLLGLP